MWGGGRPNCKCVFIPHAAVLKKKKKKKKKKVWYCILFVIFSLACVILADHELKVVTIALSFAVKFY